MAPALLLNTRSTMQPSISARSSRAARTPVAVRALLRPAITTVVVTAKVKDDLKKLNTRAQSQKQKDAELLAMAKSGKGGADGRMSQEQYAALKRKIGGTARDYFKDYIQPDVKTAYMKPTEGTSVPGLYFLVGVVAAVLATTAYVAVSL